MERGKLLGSRFIKHTEKRKERKEREIMRGHNAKLDLWMSRLSNAWILRRPKHTLSYRNASACKLQLFLAQGKFYRLNHFFSFLRK
jgi:hypothetical protein